MDDLLRPHDPDKIAAAAHAAGANDRLARTHDEPAAECGAAECPRRPSPAMAQQPAVPPSRHGFWGSLTEAEQSALLACADKVVYPVGTVIWREGQPADEAVVIRLGAVRISVDRGGHEQIIAFRGAGDIIGERAALLLRQRSATVVAMDTVHGLRITTPQFATYLRYHPRVIAVMEREMYDRLTEQPGPAPSHDPYATAYQPNTAPHLPYPTGVQPHEIAPHPHATMTQPRPHFTPLHPDPRPAQPHAGLAHAHVNRTPPYGTTAQHHPHLVPAQAGPVSAPPYEPHAGPAHVHPHSAPPPRAPSAGTPGLAGGGSWSGQNCTILYTDIAGFSAAHRNDVDRREMRHAMYCALREAFEKSQVAWDACHSEDRGDGALVVVPPEVPTADVIDPMLTVLAARLRRHNQRSSAAVQIQLRVAVDVGPVMPDPDGVGGIALIRAARLLDARPLKNRLAATGADLGFIASRFVYESVIAQGSGFEDPAAYEFVSCQVKKLRIEGWLHLRGMPTRSAM